MRNHARLVATLLLALVLGAGTLFAQGSFAPSLSRTVVGTGGGASSGGSFSLNATVGQSAAGPASGGSYTLSSGFWGQAGPGGQRIFLPLVRR
ncbi:MAG: hypothetical protein MUD01_18965 [Chloroflexaceae bacterium]|jgi:hypothetical protein|nr:hypothetical protein [Chloroflexaceae bacterium]